MTEDDCDSEWPMDVRGADRRRLQCQPADEHCQRLATADSRLLTFAQIILPVTH